MLRPQSSINATCDSYHGVAMALWRHAVAALPHRLDVAYGAHEEQRLDLFFPAQAAAAPLPIFLDIHGGGWTHGYKEWMALAAPEITSCPAIFVSLGYRLAPAAKHPAQLQDCLAAIAWLVRHAEEIGGDASRIHVGGHSAGAHLAALASLRTDLHAAFDVPPDVIRSCFCYSGLYDLRGAHGRAVMPGVSPVPMLADAGEEADASPLLAVREVDTAFHISWGQQEIIVFQDQGRAFADELVAAGNQVTADTPDLDHFWIHLDHARGDSEWVRALHAQMR
ncbi:alpha/beta hydrolase [Sphingomonas sp. BK580]|uniref:alpha/beta hydrolase n=1 Tax=Sphingomonas sp. BK580 TaxID=2586972 RepID=UPI00161B23C9|nr:alpha/beta hydrolase [Sphingomonas sp. BK580]MBB3694489.1 acetyl esterase/lipase [Sphingomonas sp. BK580]